MSNSADPNSVDVSIKSEMFFYDKLPAPIREVIRNAPMNVCVVQMVGRGLHKNDPEWLRQQIEQAYRRKFTHQA